jgi:Mg-chelatase subunit ChlD
MSGLEFLTPMFLVGAAAAAVPVIIHLVQRRRVQRVVFGSVRFLRKMSQRVVRRRRFTELLLILLRTLALAALAFGFARPFLWQPTDRTGHKLAPGQEAALILIDNSYSMMAGDRLAEAKRLAREALEELDLEVKVGVARFGTKFEEIAPIGSSLTQARQAIDALAQSWEGTDLFKALDEAQERLTGSDRPEQKRTIILISDFQESAWRFAERRERGEPAATAPAEAPEALTLRASGRRDARPAAVDWKLKPGIRLQVRDVAEKQAQEEEQARQEERKRPPTTGPAGPVARRKRRDEFDNVFIERVAPPLLAVAGGLRQVISAKIVNHTDKPLSNATVVLEMARKGDGAKTGETYVAVARDVVNVRPQEETVVHFRHAFEEPGDAVGSVRLQIDPKTSGVPDELPYDNVAYFSIPVMPKVNVLVVNGDPNPLLHADDAFFINTALAPRVQEVTSPFQVREVGPASLTPSDIRAADAVIFTNVDAVPPENLPALEEFLRAGGGAAFFVGAKVRPETFNRTFGAVAPCKLFALGRKDGDDAVALTTVEYKHPLFREFYGPQHGSFDRAYFVQYFLVTESQQAQKLARFNNWHPALLEKPFGRGRTLLFVSSVDLEWNDLAVTSVFLPFVQELTRRLCGQRAAGSARNVPVGGLIAHRLPPSAGGKAEIRTPDGKVLSGDGEKKGREAFTYVPDRPGVYDLSYDGGRARFAVNLLPREPDPVRLDVKLLASSLQSDPTAQVRRVGTAAVLPKSTARERAEEQQKLWAYLLGLVLLALAAEMIIAARAGTA